jgi:flagellar FliJ protein
MSRSFPLAGLLRLRHAQQDEAGSALASANARLADATARRARTAAVLAGEPVQITDAATLFAVSAARASTRGMLAELDAMAASRRAEADSAQAAYNAARTRSIGLEKLDVKHTERVLAEDARAEQLVLDEVASTAWHRNPPEAAR